MACRAESSPATCTTGSSLRVMRSSASVVRRGSTVTSRGSAAKPACSTRTWYRPGMRFGARKRPSCV